MPGKLRSYYSEAKERSKRRRHPVNLLLPFLGLPLWLGLAFCLSHLALSLSTLIYPDRTYANLHGLAGAGIIFGPFFAMLPVSMLLLNSILNLVPPIRRILDKEASHINGTGYISSQRALFLLSTYAVVPAFIVILIGILLP